MISEFNGATHFTVCNMPSGSNPVIFTVWYNAIAYLCNAIAFTENCTITKYMYAIAPLRKQAKG